MASGVSIDILANTSKLQSEVKQAGQTLDDFADSLDDIGRDGDKIADGIEDGVKEVGTHVERLERKFKDIADAAKKQSKVAGDAIDKNVTRGTKGAEEGVENLKDESKETAREAAASFDGSAESIIDAFQEVAANAFIGFGPAGLAAGLAIAAGLGIAIQAGQATADAINQSKERVIELARAVDEAGGDIQKVDIAQMMKDWGLAIADSREWWEIWQTEATTNLEKVQEASDKTGISVAKMFGAMSGTDAGAAKEVVAELREQLEALHDGVGEEDFWGVQSNQLRGWIVEIEKSAGLTEEATGLQEALAEVTKRSAEATEIAQAAEERRNQALSTLNEAYDSQAAKLDDFIDKESGLFDTGRYIKAMQEREKAIEDYQETLASTPLTPEAKAFLDSQGVESAAQFLAGYKKATPKQQAELNRIWTEAGKKNSGTYANTMEKNLAGKTVKGPTVKVKADTSDVYNAVQRMRNSNFSFNVIANVQARYGRRPV